MRYVRWTWLLTLALLMLGSGALCAAETSVPVVHDQLHGAPWYDSTTDSWKRMDLPSEDEQTSSREDLGDGIPGFAYVMYGLIVVAVALIIMHLWRLRGSGQAPGSIGVVAPLPVHLSVLPFAVPDATGDPESAFKAACDVGDWTRAVVWLYAWQLLALDRVGVVHLLPGKTNRGYQREVSTLTPISAALGATINVFERTYFGHQPATREEVEQLRHQHQALLAALPAPEATAS